MLRFSWAFCWYCFMRSAFLTVWLGRSIRAAIILLSLSISCSQTLRPVWFRECCSRTGLVLRGPRFFLYSARPTDSSRPLWKISTNRPTSLAFSRSWDFYYSKSSKFFLYDEIVWKVFSSLSDYLSWSLVTMLGCTRWILRWWSR